MCRNLLHISFYIYNLLGLLMIKQLAVECLLTQPKLNNLSEILMIFADSSEANDRLLAAQYLSKIFSFYCDNKLLNDNSQTSKFLWGKLISYGQLLLIRLDENIPIFSSFLYKLIRIEHLTKKTLLTESLINQMVSSPDEIWGKITNGQILTKFIKQLRKKQMTYNSKVAVLVGLTTQLSFIPYLSQEKDNKRQRNGEAIAETIDDEFLKKNFMKQYEGLLVDFLKDSQAPDEYVNRVLAKLGQSIYSKIQYVMDAFLNSKNLQTKVNALAGLYILIGKYGLELNNFYERLLELITTKVDGKNVFENTKCKRIYRLLQNALRSSKVPFKIVCSFIKILFEQILVQKSEFGCWAMALIFNVTKKHRNILNSFKNANSIEIQEQSAEKELTSLSEIYIMKNHYLPQVRSILNQLSKNLSKIDFIDIEEISKFKIQKLLNKKVEELIDKQVQFELPQILHPLNI